MCNYTIFCIRFHTEPFRRSDNTFILNESILMSGGGHWRNSVVWDLVSWTHARRPTLALLDIFTPAVLRPDDGRDIHVNQLILWFVSLWHLRHKGKLHRSQTTTHGESRALIYRVLYSVRWNVEREKMLLIWKKSLCTSMFS